MTRPCQWIESDPAPDDSCKCGKPSLPRKPYCAEHHQRAYQQQIEETKSDGRQP